MESITDGMEARMVLLRSTARLRKQTFSRLRSGRKAHRPNHLFSSCIVEAEDMLHVKFSSAVAYRMCFAKHAQGVHEGVGRDSAVSLAIFWCRAQGMEAIGSWRVRPAWAAERTWCPRAFIRRRPSDACIGQHHCFC